MTREEALKLIDALMARPDAIEDGRRAFAERFPNAPKEMIDTATFHVCVDGIDAALEWIASIEQFLQNPENGLSNGATWHLLYHLYNWQQFDALLPLGKSGIAEHLKDIKTALEEEDSDFAKKTIDHLMKCLGGELTPPGIA